MGLVLQCLKKIGLSYHVDYLRYIICWGRVTLKIRHYKSSLYNAGDESNVIYLHTRAGKVIKNPFIKGLSVRCSAKSSHNRLILYERLPQFSSSVIKFTGKNSYVKIGGSTHYISNLSSVCGSDVKINIGQNFSFSGGSISCEYGGGIIDIGKDCMFGFGIMVRATDGHALYDIESGARVNDNQNVKIGNHVWLAAKTNLLKGSEIPDNSVVAAASLVNKKFVERNILIAGTPAKIIRHNIDWHRAYDIDTTTGTEPAKNSSDTE